MSKLPQLKASQGGKEAGKVVVEEEVPMKCRVLLECSAGEIATSHLRMENCGKTAMYYSWEVSVLVLCAVNPL